MTAIIFGAAGQDGHFLSALLKEQGCKVLGVSRSEGYIQADISDFNLVSDLIKRGEPDYIFHLAANSTTSHGALFENHQTIATGTLNVLESVKKYSARSKVFISGSGLQFENNDQPIKETDPFAANNAYAISRIQSVYAARYFRTLGVKTYVGYFFNHDSPLRTERFMTKKISEVAKRIAAGSAEKLMIGDLHAIKEYTYAGDVVKGIWTMINQDEITEANISSGKGYSIEDWLVQCFSIKGMAWQDHVTIDGGFISPHRMLVSDPSRILSLGWKPTVNFEDLAKMMME